MPNFVEQQFVRVPMPFLGYGPDRYLLWPYVIPDGASMARVSVRHELVPADELALHRGSGVEATDGHAGEVDEFLIDPADGHITHLILREGHVWDRKDVTIPVSQIDRIETDTIYLKLDKHGLGQLPVVAIRRRR
jgi:sporulation protein YlmC with PRC-barrel domain